MRPQVSVVTPRRLACWLCWVLILGISAWKDHHGVERDLYVLYEGGLPYLLGYDGLLHAAPDNITIEALLAKNASLDGSKYQKGAPLPTLRMTVNNPDEIIRIMVAKSLHISPSVHWLSLQDLGAMINPSIVRWANQTILCWKDSMEGHILIKSLDSPPSASTLVFKATPPLNCSTNANLAPWHFNGEDARLVPMPDGRLNFIFTSHHEYNYRMFESRAAIDPATRLISFERQEWFSMMQYAYFPKSWGRHQKNWAPFIHRGQLMFIPSFNPLHVMELVEEGAPWAHCTGQPGCGVPSNCSNPADGNETERTRAYSRTVSMASGMGLGGWEYGDPRGGTPGILLPDGKYYFALFHTRYHIPGNMLETYFMGAITWHFDAAAAAGGQFRLHSVSRAPILNFTLYDGSWTPSRHGPSHIDYVVFPLGIILGDDNDSLTISLGRQDTYGVLSTVSLLSLLAGMVCLDCA